MSNGKEAQARKNLEDIRNLKEMGYKNSIEASAWKKHIEVMLLKGWGDRQIEGQCKEMQRAGTLKFERIPSYKSIGRYRKRFETENPMNVLENSDPVAFWSINKIFDTYQLDALKEMYADLDEIKKMLKDAPISRRPKLIEMKFKMEGELLRYEIQLGIRKTQALRIEAQVEYSEEGIVDEEFERDPIGYMKGFIEEYERIMEGVPDTNGNNNGEEQAVSLKTLK